MGSIPTWGTPTCIHSAIYFFLINKKAIRIQHWDIKTDASSWHVLGNAKLCQTPLVVAQPGRATDCRGYIKPPTVVGSNPADEKPKRTCGRVVKGAGLKTPSQRVRRFEPCRVQIKRRIPQKIIRNSHSILLKNINQSVFICGCR